MAEKYSFDYHRNREMKLSYKDLSRNQLEKKSEDTLLPDVLKDMYVNVDCYNSVEKTTTCPSRLTDGKIIEIMESPSKYLEDEGLKSNKELNIITQTLQRKVSKSPLDDEEEIILQVAREELKNRDIRISTGETLVMSVLYVLGIIISVKIFTETIN